MTPLVHRKEVCLHESIYIYTRGNSCNIVYIKSSVNQGIQLNLTECQMMDIIFLLNYLFTSYPNCLSPTLVTLPAFHHVQLGNKLINVIF